MWSYLSNLQLGFCFLEERGEVLILLPPFFEPTEGAGDDDIVQPARQITHLFQFQPSLLDRQGQHQVPSPVPLKWRMERYDPNVFFPIVF